jgi:dienelactone hydrolase
VPGALLAVAALPAQEKRTESFLGNLAPIARSIQQERGFALDFAHRGALSVDEWRLRGRAEVNERLAYWPAAVPLDLQVESVHPRDGYEIRVVTFAGSPHYRIPAYLLVPSGRGPFPAVVALHDHGGWFYHGKEKLVRMDGEHVALAELRAGAYGGRAYAEELARRGYVVLVADAFYWGGRRLQYEQPPRELSERLQELDPASPEYVRVMNRYLLETVPLMRMWLSYTGTLWGGIVAQDDRRGVALLASLPEVDAGRIGCVGLSGGGYRATYLAGLEPRIKAGIIVGWMSSLPTTLDLPYPVHIYMMNPPGVHARLDHPDIASLGAPDCAIFVQHCGRDRLFTGAGMDAASDKIRQVYEEIGRPERFQSRTYDVPHSFDRPMQEDAFAWLDRWLKR